MRALVRPVTTPLLADDYLKLVNPLWSARELRGRIVAVRPETRDSATLVIKPGWGYGFAHQPGQYVGIGLLVDGRWRWRSYSLTSPARPGAARTLSITVKAMPEGFLSTHLVNGVRPGTVVRLAAPQGSFVMSDPPPASVLLLTGGSGITPVMSMLRTMVRRGTLAASGGQERSDSGTEPDVVHLHSAPTVADVMFADELAELGRSHPGYRLTVRATRTEGRLDLSRLPALVPDWRDRQTWVCGPEGMLSEAEKLWAAEGVTARLHLERFTAARIAAADGGGTVTFARSGTTRAADAATSVLEAGERAGVRLPFGCRMGICHTCVVSLVDGRVRDLRTGAEYEPGTRVQTCVVAPSGDCVVDI
ncbi:MAG: ferredoxin reductase [Mycobacterium sp.]|nr:ferredoxin reductase [Mycobacterium sp.]